MPLPGIDIPLDTQLKHPVIMEMIRTGWMFQFTKVAEILTGIGLVANRFVPLVLALTAPLAFITFMLDALILDDVLGWLTGSVAILLQAYNFYLFVGLIGA